MCQNQRETDPADRCSEVAKSGMMGVSGLRKRLNDGS